MHLQRVINTILLGNFWHIVYYAPILLVENLQNNYNEWFTSPKQNVIIITKFQAYLCKILTFHHEVWNTCDFGRN